MEDISVTQDVLICDTTSAEHQVILQYFDMDTEPLVYTMVHLSHKPFLKRLIYGIKYILGYKSRYGAFEELILGPEHVEKLKKAINHIVETDARLKKND